MKDDITISNEEVEQTWEKTQANANSSGYNLNPDNDFTFELIRGLLINEKRYGYQSCPCRLAEGEKADDLDIICPCDYRDPDIDEYGVCYCSLYVSIEIVNGEQETTPIPERRPDEIQRAQKMSTTGEKDFSNLPFPVWRCTVCGYLCARGNPPETCPICKANKERFQNFI